MKLFPDNLDDIQPDNFAIQVLQERIKKANESIREGWNVKANKIRRDQMHEAIELIIKHNKE